tara:strand:+ start:1948 stop:2247 length:300 start_codon:yes stop_codon:yes gene_type:complete
MSDQEHSYLDEIDADGCVRVTLPSHVTTDIIDGAIEKIMRTDFGKRASYAREGHTISVVCEPMAFVDSAVEHLVEVVRATLTGKFRPRPDEGPSDQMPF